MTDDDRWQQVLARSAEPDATLLYAVRTTGVFCRPTCASRRPVRRNIVFFGTADDARAAGFRACRRCRPDDQAAGGSPATGRVVAACRAMEAAGGPLDAEALAAAAGVSARQLSRDFAAVLGTTPGAFGEAVRIGEARQLLRAHGRVADAVYDAGYGSARGFYERTAPTLGMAPAAYAAGAAAERLRWTVVDAAIGRVLAVASERGLCAVRLGSDVDALLAEVQAEFPRAELTRDDATLTGVADALRALAGETSELPAHLLPELPLDLRGTAFRARVWQALRDIPRGETRTYAEVAAALGAPAAVRAVAGACAANRVALVVPCHRVVRTDGGLGGYRWGVDRKRALLEAERQ